MTMSLRGSHLPFVGSLADHGGAIALIHDDGRLSYQDLAERVAQLAGQLPAADIPEVCVVPLERTVDSVVGYLAVLAAGHVAAVVAPGQESTLEDFAPELRAADGRIERLRPDAGAAVPHPDLAVLLSTSGSTGSSKLVRLERESLQQNAEAIAESLHLRADDCAVTSLPLHYCYGLSILHSHLAVGASIVLSGDQVSDESFWRSVAEHRVTTVAGVPHSFEMMLRSGLAERALPNLRRFTVAGGRLASERVREVRSIGARRGWDLYVMYGQTEATARMSVLQPADADESPGSVGTALAGGSFEIDPHVPEAAALGPGVGEVVYRGPNVMLGYATSRWDLVGGRDVDALRTGDLGYLDAAGRLQIVGRRSGFVKIVGKRVDLAGIERIAGELVREVCAVGDDHGLDLVYVAERSLTPADVTALVLARTGLPTRAVRALEVPALPLLASGKLDRQAVRELAREAAADRAATERAAAPGALTGSDTPLEQRVLAAYRECLGTPDAGPADSFLSLGGDSLSFVELSVRLEALIGDLPDGWQQTSIAELAASAEPPRACAAVDTSLVLRAIAAMTILGTHIGMFTLLGGAHTLLAVLGFNAARFSLRAETGRNRGRRLLHSAAGIAVPAVIWVLISTVALDAYRWPNLLLINWFAGEDRWDSTDQLWFIETAVWSLVLLAAIFSIPVLRRWYRARPEVVVGGLLAAALVPRFVVLPYVDGPVRGFLPFAFWLVALGMAAGHARTTRQRAVLSVVAVVGSFDFYGLPGRETYIAVGILALLWLPTIRVPRQLLPVLTPLAGASLYIYLIQWQVFPYIPNPLLAFVLSLLAGVVAWYGVGALQRLYASRRRNPNLVMRRRPRTAVARSARLLVES